MRLDQSLIQKLLLEKIPQIEAIYLFGSCLTDFFKSDSDIDIAILTPRGLDNVFRWEVGEYLAQHLLHDIDLVDLRQASTVMCFEIVSSGQCIYCKDVFNCENFENIIGSMYQRFQEERKPILEAIEKNGHIYGQHHSQ